MSQPNIKSELHEAVWGYCQKAIAEPREAYYLHEEIDNPEKRTDRFYIFTEYLEDTK